MTRKRQCRIQLAASEPVAYRLVYQFVVHTKINRLTLKRFEEKYLLLSGFTLEVVQISPANILYSTHV